MKRLLVGLVIALTASFASAHVYAAGVNDFVITNYDIEYTLGRDESNRSTLKTVETITARFPDYDQNHGIERALPKSYDGHPTNVVIESVKHSDGSDWNYETRTSNDNMVLRIGDADRYVQGEQSYVITYTQRDVTKSFANTKSDEFYWDTNGTEWAVPIENLNVTLKLDDNLAKQLTGNASCYEGVAGTTTNCTITRKNKNFTATANSLAAGENITIAMGFAPSTFAQYERSFLEWIGYLYTICLVAAGAFGLVAIIWISALWARWTNRKKELGTVVPEYIPPEDTSVTTAASLGMNKGSVFTAQLLDFAVRHYIKVYQTREKSFFKQAEYEIEIVKDITSLKQEEQELLKDIFARKTAVGSRLALKSLKNNTAVYTSTLNNDKQLKALVRGPYGLRQKDQSLSARLKKYGWWLLGLAVVLLNPVIFVAAILAFILAATLWPLTDKGLALYRYLEGLKMYISVAEVERITMLQSPEGVQKVGAIDTADGEQLLTLYERVLPYAVLFGQEKEWNKRLGSIYESTGKNPDWYSSSNGVFNAAVFSSAMNGFSTAASYSSASSSSSGGSSGGGSSGGGGGGGGGGGW